MRIFSQFSNLPTFHTPLILTRGPNAAKNAGGVAAQGTYMKLVYAVRGAEFDKLRISWANVTWWLDGGKRETATPTIAELLSLKQGDFCGLIPPPSKADQFGRKWLNNTIWLPFSPTAPINAARALAQYELAARVPPHKRRSTPLFCGPGGVGTSLAADAFSTRRLVWRQPALRLCQPRGRRSGLQLSGPSPVKPSLLWACNNTPRNDGGPQ